MSKANSPTRISKFMALVLRHDPSAADVTLDTEGWTPVADLLRGMKTKGYATTRDELNEIVATDDKGRYSFSPNGTKIRANQGHSLDTVELTFDEAIPPDLLYHGTVSRSLDAIFRDGLLPMKRHHVHLSGDLEIAKKVGSRRGRAVVIEIQAGTMSRHGCKFYRSTNGVWLVDAVPRSYLSIAFTDSGESE